ncbi:MAG: hypothetical protein Q9160_008636 [Pyrenula sp. 1 TL-2023]
MRSSDISLINEWLQRCEERHTACKKLNSLPSPLPTRVINVRSQTESGLPFLQITNSLPAQYVALSYVWGPAGHEVLLTHESIGELQKSIDITRLSKTFVEAIQLTRDLGIQYLWTDALCIMQGDPVDWAIESKKMADIFGNAYLTIVAGSAASAGEGFLKTPLQRSCSPCPIRYRSWKPSEASLELGDCYVWLPRSHNVGPLAKRAWCFQEHILSPRKIVFGSDQMSYECERGTRNEDGSSPTTRIFNMANAQSIIISNPPPAKEVVLRYWYTMLVQYTDREMTNPRDKFPAISSVASLVGDVLGCRYLAGIWEDDMIRGMSWMTVQAYNKHMGQPLTRPTTSTKEHLPRKKLTRAPSWSWASVEGCVFVHHSRFNERRFCDPQNFRLWPSDPDNGAWGLKTSCTPSMDAGELHVKGVLKRVRVFDEEEEEAADVESWRKAFKNHVSQPRWASNPYAVPIVEDGEQGPAGTRVDKTRKDELNIVGFGWFDIAEEKRSGILFCTQLVRLQGLMLEEAGPGIFRRLGAFMTNDACQPWFDEQELDEFVLV